MKCADVIYIYTPLVANRRIREATQRFVQGYRVRERKFRFATEISRLLLLVGYIAIWLIDTELIE